MKNNLASLEDFGWLVIACWYPLFIGGILTIIRRRIFRFLILSVN